MTKQLRFWILPLFTMFAVSLLAQEYGIASYYSDRYQGRRTAYGDTYDKNKMTCSHKIHPYGTLLKVTRMDNNKSVVCKVIDKGPYTKGRIVDLSRASAEKIDLIKDGVAEVKVEVYKRESEQTEPATAAADPPRKEEVTPSPSRASQEAAPAPAPKREETAEREAPQPEKKKPAPEKKELAADPNRLVGQDYKKFGLYRIRLERGPQEGFGVQVMVVSDYESVMKALSSLQARHFDDLLVSVEPGQKPGQTLYKIIMGPFESEASAKNYQSNLKERYSIRGFVVDLNEKVDVSPPEEAKEEGGENE